MNPFPPDCALKFRAERELARGGYGSVWLATQARLRREVAVKLLHPDLLTSAHDVDRFLAEARVTAKFRHPNIVRVIDHGVEHDVPWIAFEYLPGRTLEKMLAAGALPWPEALSLATQIAAALEEAHAHGVLHRDIKPSNVVEIARGQVKVTDFGIAKWAERKGLHTATGVIVGTPCYLAPEVITGQPASALSDLYALGVVTYQMLAGRVPFGNENPLTILSQHCTEAAQPPSSVNPDVPAGLDEIVLKLLSKAPQDRYPDAAAARAALVRFAQSAGADTPRMPSPHAPTAPEAPRSVRRVPSRGRLVATGALAGLLLALAVAAVVPAHNETPAPAPSPSSPASLAPADRGAVELALAELAGRVRDDPSFKCLHLTEASTAPDVPGALRMAEKLEAREAASIRALVELTERVERASSAELPDARLRARASAYRFAYWRRRMFLKRIVDVFRWAIRTGNDSVLSAVDMDMQVAKPADHAEGQALLQRYLEAAQAALRAVPAALPAGGAGAAELLDDLAIVARETNSVTWTPAVRTQMEARVEAFKRALAADDRPLASSTARLASAYWDLGHGPTLVRRKALAQLALEELKMVGRQAPAAEAELRRLTDQLDHASRR